MKKPDLAAIGDNNNVEAYGVRLNTLLDELQGLKEDIKEVYIEAKANGVDVAALRFTIRVARKDRDVERMVTVNEYLQRLGKLPLFALSKH